MSPARRAFLRLGPVIREGIAELYPGYFALVMATGIVSIAAHLLGFGGIAGLLLRINVVCAVVLAGVLLARIAFYFPLVARDLMDHSRGPGFFTVVAGTCVLGSQIVLLRRDLYVGSILWAVGSALWFVLMYGFLTAATVRSRKPALVAGINGSWLIAIVATQSVSVLGSTIAEVMQPWSDVALFFSLATHLAGELLYLLFITLIFYRLTFFDLDAESLTPPYWINMGAVAITTLAGTTLLLRADGSTLLTDVAPFLTGFTLFFWSFATWWIPLLLLLGAWRHLYRRVSLRYEPQYWGMVFPLGMYSAATFQLAHALRIGFILPLSYAFFYIALFAWLAAFGGLLYRLVSTAWGRARAPAAILAALDSPGRSRRSFRRDHPGGDAAARSPAGSHAGATSVAVHLLCPLHGVQAEIRLVAIPASRTFAVAECSLLRLHGPMPPAELRCEGRCVWNVEPP
jgi:tellurite resistance protein TehA-like permease